MSKKHQVITISPSGNLYGSENVLFDYLYTTELNHIVFVPNNSPFEQKLKSQKWNHRIKSFNPKRLKLFYAYLILFILISRIKSVYVNEGGHYKWILLLAKFLRNTSFVVHIRIIEDIKRISERVPDNVEIVTISSFMMSLFDSKLKPTLIRDPFTFSDSIGLRYTIESKPIIIGIIGRISLKKGIVEVYKVVKAILSQNNSNNNNIRFVFFGSESSDEKTQNILNELKALNFKICEFAGFVETKEIYQQIDIVLHLAKEEPLGRIFFEAMNYEKPLIGFNSGGIGELGQLTKLEGGLVNHNSDKWVEQIIHLLDDRIQNYKSHRINLKESKKKYLSFFSQNTYNSDLNKLLK